MAPMSTTRNLAGTLLLLYALGTGASMVRADECENVIVRHMVGEALLTAHLVAMAEKAGVKPSEINAILKDIAEKSANQEFWITDSRGHAYLTNTGVDFTFSSDPTKQPQASAFWPLIGGGNSVVIQDARKREIDDRMFKYVGVAGIDKPRIVQIGVGAEHLPHCK
jgi:adenylate cyclase